MSKTFEELYEELQVLYNQAENLFESSNSDLNSVKATIAKINNVYSDLERVVINETDNSRKETLMALLQAHHVVKSKFDGQATAGLTSARLAIQRFELF